MSIVQYFSHEENQKAYKDWINDPVTKAVLAEAHDIVRPIGMSQPKGEDALYLHGMLVGATIVLDTICKMDLIAQNVQNATAESQVEATFGAEQVLAELGYAYSDGRVTPIQKKGKK